MTKASDNPFPSILIVEGTEPSAPSAGQQRVYIDSTTHKLKATNSSGTDRTIEGSVATDTIWDAAGDLAVGSGADTAARMALGAAGGAVSRVNGAVAWNSGTGFPTAATGDRYWRTDLGEEYYYDGTRWLSTTIRVMSPLDRTNMGSGYTSTQTVANYPTLGATGDQWVVSMRIAAFASAGAFDGSNYWVVTFDKLDAANAATNVATATMNSQTSNNWKQWLTTVGASVVGGTYLSYKLIATKTGSPGTLIMGAEILYRTIAT